MDRLVPDFKGTESRGHHGHAFDLAAWRFNLDLFPVLDAAELGQFFADFHIGLRLRFREPRHPSGLTPGAPVLGAAVGGADERKVWITSGELVAFLRIDPDGWVAHLRGHGVLGQRSLKWFIVLGERPFHHAGTEQGGDAVRLHDERQFALFLVAHGRPRTVRDITHPFAVLPFKDRTTRIEGLSILIYRRPVVDDAAVDRPRPAPLRKEAGTSRIFRFPAGHEVFPILGKTSAINPVAAGSLSVCLEETKTGNTFSLFERLVAHRNVFHKNTVHCLGGCYGIIVAFRIGIVPCQIKDGIGEGAFLFLVEIL